MLPNDPFILLSYVNTKLRDFYPSLDDMCKSMNIDKSDIVEKLKNVDFMYDLNTNQFQ